MTPVTLVFATAPGALDAYTSTCMCCGLVIRNSFETEAKRDAADHADWHNRKDSR